jgi:putative ABC transport system permease protein
MAAQLDLALGRVTPPARQLEIMEALRQRIESIPTVRSVGYGSGLPPAGEFMRMSFVLNNAANTASQAHIVTSVPASPGYFSTLQVPLLKGRFFTDADTATAPVVGILSREAARRFYGNDDPIGRILPFGDGDITIVGLVENVKYTGIVSPLDGVVYRPYSQQPFRLTFLVARTSGEPSRIVNDIRQAVRSYDPGVNVISAQPLTGWISDSIAQPRFRALLLSTIAGITLALAIVGLYGVIAYSTSQRTSEIGLRVAIGAQRSDVVRMVLAEGARLALIGVVVGLAGSYWATRLLSSFLYQVTATDPGAFGGAAIALFLVALLATYLPARKAARVDPMTALRVE